MEDLVIYLSSEGFLHDDTEQDLSNPKPIDCLYHAELDPSRTATYESEVGYSIYTYSSQRSSSR